MGLKPQDSIFQSIGEDLTFSPEQLAVQAIDLQQTDHELHQSIAQLLGVICDDCVVFVLSSIKI